MQFASQSATTSLQASGGYDSDGQSFPAEPHLFHSVELQLYGCRHRQIEWDLPNANATISAVLTEDGAFRSVGGQIQCAG
jgi:hypothetical protein